ncbi:MAG: alpha/beta hydrolase, partial [Rhizobiaceae bacterium]|nr:alpha/beta hydrolase [Rhizobiaceae bacterium]
MTKFLFTGPENAAATILFAHGAGGAMDTPWMNSLAAAFAANDMRLARFEFAYMASRRSSGTKSPPPKVEMLMREYNEAIASARIAGPLVIGGKSMGGRVASMIADDRLKAGNILGLVCVGYPFHPPGQPEKLRTAHLADLRTPALVCQGTRDQFGSREEVSHYKLSERIEIVWLEDGNHDLTPRKASGFSGDDHL